LAQEFGLEIVAKFKYYKQSLQKDPTKSQKLTNFVQSSNVANMAEKIVSGLERKLYKMNQTHF
ncbi:MAG: hypothetical protein O4803_10325, partial [Trichodesmium sp. St15_bin1_1]|nr:hypothetical protein [Trichodesmium sp. St16_bin2-tuft]MDE5107817.1 hypothetical protein [Trichodesmium sp. St17_bin3_1_1]MDE5114625.1 hypothetical protein [Trichodesmium sp. St15_bin1_1]